MRCPIEAYSTCREACAIGRDGLLRPGRQGWGCGDNVRNSITYLPCLRPHVQGDGVIHPKYLPYCDPICRESAVLSRGDTTDTAQTTAVKFLPSVLAIVWNAGGAGVIVGEVINHMTPAMNANTALSTAKQKCFHVMKKKLHATAWYNQSMPEGGGELFSWFSSKNHTGWFPRTQPCHVCVPCWAIL